MSVAYPRSGSPAERTRWILENRGARNSVQPHRPYAFFNERERALTGEVRDLATIFLTNRECPWNCVMCDLWKNTTTFSVSAAELAEQIEFALGELKPAAALKLYNSGSFFDSGAIPRSAWKQIAELANPFDHLIVECHPRLVSAKILEFASLLTCSLEVAMGLETAHPEALEAMNKRITPSDYADAARFLKKSGLHVRTFLLVNPPFIPAEEQAAWLRRSAEFAFEHGSDIVSLIPLRTPASGGVGERPTLSQLESAHQCALELRAGLVFADTWDLELFSRCDSCLARRSARLQRQNLTQQLEPQISCEACHG